MSLNNQIGMLRQSLLSPRRLLVGALQQNSASGLAFQLMSLPEKVRNLIFQHTLVPPSKHVHPYIKSWRDDITRNLTSVLAVSRQLRSEAEQAFYQNAIFSSPTPDFDIPLQKFFTNLPPHLRAMIRHARISSQNLGCELFLHYMFKNLQLRTLTYIIPGNRVQHLNNSWPYDTVVTYTIFVEAGGSLLHCPAQTIVEVQSGYTLNASVRRLMEKALQRNFELAVSSLRTVWPTLCRLNGRFAARAGRQHIKSPLRHTCEE